METKNIEINYKGRPEVVEIKKLTFGEKASLRKKCRKISFTGNRQNIDIDEEALMLNTLVYGIKSAPFNHTDINTIKNLDGDIGEKLYTEIDKFNTVSEGKKNEAAERNKERVHDNGGHEGKPDVLHSGEGDGSETG